MISQQTIDQVRDTLVKEFNPVEIYLFGSYAWGHPDDESDLDLLVVVDKAEEDRSKMLVRGHQALTDFRIAKDIIIYTKSEFDNWSQEIPRLSYTIKTKGRLLYGQASACNDQVKKSDIYLELLRMASERLNIARSLLNSGDCIHIALFSTNQCAEWALKSFLAYHQQELEKTHNLLDLLNRCLRFDSYFENFKKNAEDLNNYPLESQYPGEHFVEANLEILERAVTHAKQIFDFVQKYTQEN